MDTPLWDRLINSQILHFGGSEDDVLIWFLDWGYEFIWRPTNLRC